MADAQPTQTSDDYGRDSYSYLGGMRFRVGRIRTIRPTDGETNGGFQRRINQLAGELIARHGALTIDTDFEIAAGGYTQCLVSYTHAPVAEPEPAEDERPAGGRVVPIRGGRRTG